MKGDAAEILARAGRIAVLTGAGVSAESGVATFRGADGTWNHVNIEEVATPRGFERDPARVWRWYEERRASFRAAQPNPGHRALAELESRRDVTLVTQNIDGLHQRAGSRRVVEFHGSAWRVRCTACGRAAGEERVPLPELPPRCACGAPVRPDVVWFGELIPAHAWSASIRAVETADAFLLVGTSAVVTPAADLAALALQREIPLVEVNLDPTPFSALAAASLRGRSGEILPRLLSQVR
jgi:NAD-dependent deacetylase